MGATLHCGAQASHCGGFSFCRAWALDVQASVVVAHGLSSCGLRALERKRGLLFVAVRVLLIVVASLVVEHGV